MWELKFTNSIIKQNNLFNLVTYDNFDKYIRRIFQL